MSCSAATRALGLLVLRLCGSSAPTITALGIYEIVIGCGGSCNNVIVVDVKKIVSDISVFSILSASKRSSLHDDRQCF